MNIANMIGLGNALSNAVPNYEKGKQQKFENALSTRKLDLEQQRNEEQVQQRALQMAMLQANRDELNANRRLGRDQQMAENLPPQLLDENSGVGQNTISSLTNAGFGSLLTKQNAAPASLPALRAPQPPMPNAPDNNLTTPFGNQSATSGVPQLSIPNLPAPVIPEQKAGMNWPGTIKTQDNLQSIRDREAQNQFMNLMASNRDTRAQNTADNAPNKWDFAAFQQMLRNSAPGNQTPFQPLGADGKPLPGFLSFDTKSGGSKFNPFPEGIVAAGKWGANGNKNQALYRDNATSRAMTDIDTTLQESLRLRGLLEKAGLSKNNNPIGPAFANWLATGLGIDPSDPDAKGMAAAISKGDRTQAAGFIQGMATKAMLQGSGARGQIIQQTLGKHILDPKFSNQQAHQVINDMIREYINLRENTQRKAGVAYEQDPFTLTYGEGGEMLPQMQPVDSRTFRSYGIPTGPQKVNVIDPSKVKY